MNMIFYIWSSHHPLKHTIIIIQSWSWTYHGHQTPILFFIVHYVYDAHSMNKTKKKKTKIRFSYNCMFLYEYDVYIIHSEQSYIYSHDYISTIFIGRTKERVKHFILMCFLCVHFIFCLVFFHCWRSIAVVTASKCCNYTVLSR